MSRNSSNTLESTKLESFVLAGGILREKKANVGAGLWVEGRRIVTAVQLMEARVVGVWLLWVIDIHEGP